LRLDRRVTRLEADPLQVPILICFRDYTDGRFFPYSLCFAYARRSRHAENAAFLYHPFSAPLGIRLILRVEVAFTV
jgi:hypothetical protein